MARFLLEYARADLDIAKTLLDNPDEFWVRGAAFHTQQCIEKTFKQVLMDCGVTPRKSHVFRLLLEELPEWQNIISTEHLDYLQDNSDRFTNWATEIKYSQSYITTRREVLRVMKFAEEFYNAVAVVLNAPVDAESKPTIDRMKLD